MHKFSTGHASNTSSDALREVVSAMLEHVDDLGERAAGEIRSAEPSYRELVDEHDLQEACTSTVALLLHRLVGDIPAELDHVLDDLGRRRARQGVGMDALLGAFRTDFRLVWQLLTDWLADRPVVREHWQEFVLPLWKAVDEISVYVSQVYRTAEAELLNERERDLRTLFDELLHGIGPITPIVRQVASRYGLGENNRYLVVRADEQHDPHTAEAAVRRLGAPSVWWPDSGVVTGIVAVDRTPQDRLAGTLDGVLRGRVGLSPEYRSLQDTRRHVWLADAARDSVPPGTHAIVNVGDDIVSTFVGGAREIADHLASSLLAGLMRTTDAERQRIVSTLRVHVSGSGSPGETAERLYRHRNTVLNHLRRFEELTGLDLSRPDDLTVAVLGLRAIERLGVDTAGKASETRK